MHNPQYRLILLSCLTPLLNRFHGDQDYDLKLFLQCCTYLLRLQVHGYVEPHPSLVIPPYLCALYNC